MLPACNSGAGMNIGFPDVCATPVGPAAVPIPYPNMALNATAVPFAESVFISCVPALNMGAEMPMTLGDQAGTLSPFMGPGRFTMGNPTVFVEALPAVSLLSPTTGNNMVNALGAAVVPSITNVFYSRASIAAPDALDADALAALAKTLKGRDARASIEHAGDGLVRIALPMIGADAAAIVFDAIRAATSLVLDLRGCPGGDLLAAIELASDFLDEGALVATVIDGDGDAREHRARAPRLHRLPTVVVVDGATASAAEIVAGALAHHGRALVVGRPTFGKSTAQSLVAEPSGARYATVARVLVPGAEAARVDPHLLVPDAFDALPFAESAARSLSLR